MAERRYAVQRTSRKRRLQTQMIDDTKNTSSLHTQYKNFFSLSLVITVFFSIALIFLSTASFSLFLHVR
jgi:hypothetical protein